MSKAFKRGDVVTNSDGEFLILKRTKPIDGGDYFALRIDQR